MTAKTSEIDKEVLKRALEDPKSEERKQVAATMIAAHKAAVIEMLRAAGEAKPRLPNSTIGE